MKIGFTITAAGLSALVDSESAYTNRVTIAELGLSSSTVDVAPTLTAIPGEFKRLATVSGKAVSENIVHFVARDDSADAYTVSTIGLYLADGVLFGVYSHDGELFGKSAFASFLLAADLTFEAGIAELIDFGDANFLYPPATETDKGVAYLATAADVAAGVDAQKIVTPARLAAYYVPRSLIGVPGGIANIDLSTGKIPPSLLPPQDSIDTFYAASDAEMTALAAAGPGDFCQRTDLNKTYRLAAAPPSVLANWIEFLSPGAPVRTVNGKIGDVVLGAADVNAVPTTRTIGGTGLVTGGGALSSNRTLDVAIASAAETLAGLINTKAVTPASLASVLAQLAAAVPDTRRVDAGGLATGGGRLNADRTISVAKASAADVEAGTDDAKAITPAGLFGTLRSIAPTGYLRVPGTPLVLQWGSYNFPITAAGAGGSSTIAFPIAFPSACYHVLLTLYGDPNGGGRKDEADETFYVATRSAASFNVATSGDVPALPIGFLAFGV